MQKLTDPSLSRDLHSTGLRTLVVAGYLAACVLAGLVASSGSPLFIALSIAAIAGIGFFMKPTLIINVILFAGLLIAGLLPLFLEGFASKTSWAISGLGLLLAAAAALNFILTSSPKKTTPVFVWLTLVFVAYCTINSAAQFSSIDETFGGFKRYFQVIGLVFAGAWISLTERSISNWRKLFFIVALCQLPWALYQLHTLVPYREAVRIHYPGMIPIDVVAGTFGASKHAGGSNGEMAAFAIIILAFFLSRLRSKLIGVKQLAWLIPILAPLALGETKVVVVLLPLLFLGLYRNDFLRRPIAALGGLIIFAFMTTAALQIYASISGRPINDQIEDVVRYNLQDKGYGGLVLNRTTALTFWATQQSQQNPIGPVFGHGLGTAHSATDGSVARMFPRFGIDLSAASTLLWEQGVFGTSLFISILVAAWLAAGRLAKIQPDPTLRADAFAIQASLPIIGFYLIYRVGTLEGLPYQIVIYSMLGYLAWMNRQSVTFDNKAAA